jgi:hypothetical protein
MPSFLDKKDGVYDRSKRFIIHNWSNEDFTQHFGAETGYNGDKVVDVNPARDITIKSGDSRECGEFEALTICRNFVTREMGKEADKIENPIEKNNKGMMIDNATVRKPYEDKTMSEIKEGEESPLVTKMKQEAVEAYIRNSQMKSGDVSVPTVIVPSTSDEELRNKIREEERAKIMAEMNVQKPETTKVDKRTKEYKEANKEFAE